MVRFLPHSKLRSGFFSVKLGALASFSGAVKILVCGLWFPVPIFPARSLLDLSFSLDFHHSCGKGAPWCLFSRFALTAASQAEFASALLRFRRQQSFVFRCRRTTPFPRSRSLSGLASGLRFGSRVQFFGVRLFLPGAVLSCGSALIQACASSFLRSVL
jgi:hypothetical protein